MDLGRREKDTRPVTRLLSALDAIISCPTSMFAALYACCVAYPSRFSVITASFPFGGQPVGNIVAWSSPDGECRAHVTVVTYDGTIALALTEYMYTTLTLLTLTDSLPA